ncbi:hypothetical protein [Protofrankia symbiont of Coriaria ruscifolia]|uniref:hypothetical protein n=1 Tax=Protofrankia symbiont of Coriaria ruscifolia TaxID=1306542 RepID=UPI0010416FA2|nr:hypothetical protein [Protofrankia symbiont of Coriaria ruscifolia]
MAVTVDVNALLAEVGPEAARHGRESVADGRVSGLAAVNGGVRATVTDREGNRSNVSVVIVGRTLVGDCDRDNRPDGTLCEHAVAVVVAALDAGITWTVTADVAGAAVGLNKNERMVAEAAAALTRIELIGLVVEQASTDRLFAGKVLRRAGRLSPAGPAELDRARRLVRDAAAIPDSHRQWDFYDLVRAGVAMAEELELLAVRPPTAEVLALVEDAIGVWDGLSGYLYDAWETYETEPSEIGERLADVHLDLCEELRPDPVELGRRLAELVKAAEVESFLDAPEGYADILGEEGLDAYDAALDH